MRKVENETMNNQCPNPEELTDFPIEDPRQAHVDDCPRCQAVLMSFDAFMDPSDVPEGADLADAQAGLSEALAVEIGGSAPDGEVVRPASTFWNPFRLRGIAAAAAVVIVAVGLSMVRISSESPSSQGPVLRGAGDMVAPFRCEVTGLEKGGYLLSWQGVEEATSYRVVVYRADLDELMNYDVGGATSHELELLEGGAFCRVIALKDGDEILRSEPAYF